MIIHACLKGQIDRQTLYISKPLNRDRDKLSSVYHNLFFTLLGASQLATD